MARFFIPPHAWNPDRLALDAAETHHALDVLRMKAGDRATVFNGQGSEATVEFTEVARGHITLRRIQVSKTAPLQCEITLGQAIPKGKNMDLIIEKATELGAAAIAPLLSERTVVRFDESEALAKREKWQRVVLEAAKQCGQNWLPKVTPPVPLKEFFGKGDRYDLMLIASLQPGAVPIKKALAEAGEKRPRKVLVLVGPEGDFTPAEINLARNHGCQPVTLGPIILRTETAAIYCMSVLAHELFGE
ncbi:MAG TPA: 16S rRNA (uracil(1498)-N(3))-methyltransferase [Chthoniobacteraceae bacterium]|jgi:16S rRNA (uracil1498-N3)-methyltransferase|nr:16S rRNA (uracil(1498)-N(3))-methyltransferase [Chthoniobacteraceae bacterium]